MAEVASSLGATSQSSSDSALNISDTEGLILSPSVVEAMDRILPRSASHLLQQRLPFDDVNAQCGRMPFELRENGDKEDASNATHHFSLEEEQAKKSGLKKRISRADLEIITGKDGNVESSGRVSKRFSLDKSNDCLSKTHSDSDDVSRPFAAVREKKKEKRKRKKKQTEVSPGEHANSIGDSEDDFVSFKEARSEQSKKNSDSSLSDIDTVSKASNRILTNGGDNQDLTESESLSSSLTENGSKHELKDYERHHNSSGVDDMSNNSFSSTKENVEHRKRLECQKLPKVKLPCYNVSKHKNKIKKTFPPSFVVIEQISALLSHASDQSVNLDNASKESKQILGTVLPLSVRLKCLSNLCLDGKITCRKNKNCKNLRDLEQKQPVFDITTIPDSEDDFEVVRGGRSLRKRDKTICYVEPTEADLFVEYRGKRSRGKSKDSADVDEETCLKKRKLNSEVEEQSLPSDKTDKNCVQESPKEKLDDSKSDKPGVHIYAKAKPPQNNGPTEVVVFPKIPIQNTSNKIIKPKPIDIRAAPVATTTSSSLSGLSVLTSQPNPSLISTFPPFLTRMSTAIAPRPASAFPSPGASGVVRPQFCMVRMDGKDMLLPVLPTTTGSLPQSATLFLPGGKRLVVPHNHQMFQQMNQATRLMNSLPMSAMPMSLLSTRPPNVAQTSTSPINSVPLSIPTINSIRSIPNIPLSQANRIITPVTAYPPISTVTAVTSHQPIAPVSMAAPNSSTVVRNIRVPSSNLRAAVPNQAGGVRAVRIFVPGCQATGTPGRFATLGSLASNTSALTRLSASSDLLPQRKQTKDQLTPEQRAEKRRRLEKKYPLPPGVVIKTEPLDTPTTAQSTCTYSRSLLPGNIQVVSASRRPGVQSYRFINPASVASLGSTGLANLIVRAASGDGRQAILIPSSLGMLTTSASLRTSVTAAKSSVTPSSSSSSGAVAVTSSSFLPGGTISVLPTFTTASTNFGLTSTTSSGDAAGLDTLLSTGTRSSAGVISKLETEVDTMRKLLVAQEAMGLRGDRLDKLKDLLKKKEDALKVIAQPDNRANSSAANNVGNSEATSQSLTGQSVTELIEID